MEEPLDTSLPIDVYFKQVDECVQFAIDAENPFTPEQILTAHSYAIASCGLYTDACKLWRQKPEEEKPGQNFKNNLLKNIMTSKQAGLHSANLASEEPPEETYGFMEAFQNLAMAATTDKTTIAQLVEANAKLVESNKLVAKQITTLQQQNGNTQNSTGMPKNNFAARKSKQDWTMDPK